MAFQYPWGNLQGLNLTWFVNQFKKLREDWATAEAGIEGSLDAEIQKAEDALSDVFDARDAAAASATAAAGSATQAGTSATAAQNSATAAASSATLANTKANAAAQSETAAATSAQSALNSSQNATQKATAAQNSATAAATSETNAAASATAAGNSASAAATSETNAAASAAAAEAVEQSIPTDYSLLSETVEAISTPYITDWFNMDNDDLDVIGQPTTTNFRTPWVHKNRFGAEGKPLGGSTFYSYLISGNTAKYVGTTFNSIIQTLAPEDFIPIEIGPDYQLTALIKYKGRGLRSNTHQGGGIVFATYDEETQTVFGAPVIGNFGVSRQGENIYKHVDFVFNIGAYLPQIYTTKNIAIVYQTRSPDIEEEYILEPRLDWIGWGANRYIGNYGKPMAIQSPSFIALRNYAINDFVIIGYNLYKVTQPIATGETITPGTNCTYTTIGAELTSILNS